MPLPTALLPSSSPSPAASSSSFASPLTSLPHNLPPPPLIFSSHSFSRGKPSPSITIASRQWRALSRPIACSVAVKSDADAAPSSTDDVDALSAEEVAELKEKAAKEGARVRVKAQLKVYHVPKAPEVDLTGLEGVVKQYVCFWKGKRISANYPFKVEFKVEVEGRGLVKFFAHLREDEFEFI